MDSSTLYWITRLDGLKDMLVGAAVMTMFGILALLFWVFTRAIDEDKNLTTPVLRQAFFVLVPMCFLLSVVFILTPTTKEAAFIWLAPKIYNNETVGKEAGEVYGLMKDWLKQQTKGKSDAKLQD